MAGTTSEGQGSSDLVFKMLLTNEQAGAVIGKGGAAVVTIQADCGSKVKLSAHRECFPGTAERVAVIKGEHDSLLTTSNQIVAKVFEDARDRAGSVVEVEIKLLVPDSVSGLLIGKRGEQIRALATESGARMALSRREHMPIGVDERIVHIRGDLRSASSAVDRTLKLLLGDTKRFVYGNLTPFYNNVGALHGSYAGLTQMPFGQSAEFGPVYPSDLGGQMFGSPAVMGYYSSATQFVSGYGSAAAPQHWPGSEQAFGSLTTPSYGSPGWAAVGEAASFDTGPYGTSMAMCGIQPAGNMYAVPGFRFQQQPQFHPQSGFTPQPAAGSSGSYGVFVPSMPPMHPLPSYPAPMPHRFDPLQPPPPPPSPTSGSPPPPPPPLKSIPGDANKTEDTAAVQPTVGGQNQQSIAADDTTSAEATPEKPSGQFATSKQHSNKRSSRQSPKGPARQPIRKLAVRTVSVTPTPVGGTQAVRPVAKALPASSGSRQSKATGPASAATAPVMPPPAPVLEQA